jgi:hypothetical protein
VSLNLAIRWQDGTRTVIACQERQIRNGSLLLHTAPGMADVVVPRGLFSAAWLAGKEKERTA